MRCLPRLLSYAAAPALPSAHPAQPSGFHLATFIGVDRMSPRLLRGLIENDSAGDCAGGPRFVAEGATVVAARSNHTGTVTLPKHPNLSTGGPLLWPAGNPNALYLCDSND